MQSLLRVAARSSRFSVSYSFNVRRNVRNVRGSYKSSSTIVSNSENLSPSQSKSDSVAINSSVDEQLISNLDNFDSPPVDLELIQQPDHHLDSTHRLYVQQRNTKIVAVMQDYQNRASQMTDWRKEHEQQLSRRKLALPFSLTGFGDCSRLTRFWTQRIRGRLENILTRSESNAFIDSLSPLLIHLFEKGPDQVPDQYKTIYERYLREKDLFAEQLRQRQESGQSRSIQLPFNFAESIRKEHPLHEQAKEDALIKDEDYDNYLKHHHLLQFVANKFENVSGFQYDAEIEALSNAMWQRDYGHADPDIAPSNTPCGGCGAHLHCNDTSIPGYLPSEKFVTLSKRDMHETLCQRCDFLRLFNVSLDVTVQNEDYEKMIGELKERKGLIILMVDLLDFPCSINPRIFELIGSQRKIYVVGNKVDLLPCDGSGYLKRIKQTLLKNLKFENHVPLKNVMLISAKTGYGIENLITHLFNDWNGKGDVYLVGCTNVGKSTLFNSLLQSDLCNLRQSDIIQRATTSVWPGTTLNLLKFPLRRIEGWQLQLRLDRLHYMELRQHKLERALRNMNDRQENNTAVTLMENRISSTFRKDLPYKFDSGHPLAHKLKPSKPFDPQHPAFKNGHFFHDTPGTIYKEQILSLLTTEELLKTIPRKVIEPRTFSMHPGQTLFLAGLGRLDMISCKRKALVTVFASNYLPVHICYSDQAERFYEYFLGTDMMAVPFGDRERLAKWPQLVGEDFYLNNSTRSIDYERNTSVADIVFSSAGWASITLEPDDECMVRAFTPQACGLFMRTPAILPHAVRLRGKKIAHTPCFEKHRPFLHSLQDSNYSLRTLQLDHQDDLVVQKHLRLAPEIESTDSFPKLTAGT